MSANQPADYAEWIAALAANLPASVIEAPPRIGRFAVVWHPLGEKHPNAVEARARLIRRGFTVVTYTRHQRTLVPPASEAIPPETLETATDTENTHA